MRKKLWRVSTVALIDGDEALAMQIQGAIIAFLKTNFSSAIIQTEKHEKPQWIWINDYIDEKKVKQ